MSAADPTIQILRGLEANMPTLADGELALATDTQGLWIGWQNTNYLLAEAGAAPYQMSITRDSLGIKLVNDATTPGNYYVYGTNGSGTRGWLQPAVLPANVVLSGFRSGLLITSDVDNYDPTFSTHSTLLIEVDSPGYNMTGLAGGEQGRIIALHLVAGSAGLTLKAESASSTASNRFGFSDDVILAEKQGVLLQYDGVSSRWLMLGVSGTSGAYYPGGTDVALTDGGTGYSLSDPGADRLWGWDDSAGHVDWFDLSTGLSISGTTLQWAHLGLQSLTDPNADRIAFWDDSAGAFAWLEAGSGLSITGTTLSVTSSFSIDTLTASDIALVDDMAIWDDGASADRKVTVERVGGFFSPATTDGRLTLVSATPVLPDYTTRTPSATDTGNELIDFSSSHGYASGMLFITDTTVGGLTAGTVYYTYVSDLDTIAVCTSLDNVGTVTKVNLTASITGKIIPLGMAGSTLYFTPASKGSRIALYDATRWTLYDFSEMSIKTTDAQTGTTTNTSTTVTGLTDTTKFARGMKVTGSGIPANTTIATIPSATSITISNAATASGSVTLTFKLSAGISTGNLFDVFCVLYNGALVLRFGSAWTATTTRNMPISQQNGVYVNTSDFNTSDENGFASKTGKYLGTICVSTDGETEDSVRKRFVWNLYNRVRRAMWVVDFTNSNNYTTATFRSAFNNAANKVEVVFGLSLDSMSAAARCEASNASVVNASAGIGIDSTSVNSAQVLGGVAGSTLTTVWAEYEGNPGIGYHAINWLEISQAVGTTSWYGDNGLTYKQSGMTATSIG